MSPFQSRLTVQLSERRFQRYKRASNSHEGAKAERSALGNRLVDAAVEHLSAIDEADAALEIAGRELDVARAAYLCDPYPAA